MCGLTRPSRISKVLVSASSFQDREIEFDFRQYKSRPSGLLGPVRAELLPCCPSGGGKGREAALGAAGGGGEGLVLAQAAKSKDPAARAATCVPTACVWRERAVGATSRIAFTCSEAARIYPRRPLPDLPGRPLGAAKQKWKVFMKAHEEYSHFLVADQPLPLRTRCVRESIWCSTGLLKYLAM